MVEDNHNDGGIDSGLIITGLLAAGLFATFAGYATGAFGFEETVVYLLVLIGVRV